MTTPHPIKDTDDLLRSLDESPELTARLQNRLVPPAVQALPELLAEITQLVKANTRQINENSQLINETSRLVKENAEAQKRTEERLNSFITNQEKINAEAAADTKALKELVDRTITRIDNLYGDVSALKGETVERAAAVHLGECLIDFNINLEEVEILRCQRFVDNQTSAAINEALRVGRITPVERRQLLQTDIIAKALDIKTHETSHFVVEVSQTIHDIDLERAESRAAICAKALELPVQPLAVGFAIHPEHAEYAQASPVPVLLHPRLGPKS